MNKIHLPENPDVARELVQANAQSEHVRLSRGWIGRVLGDKDNVPSNVAGSVVFLSFLMLLWIIVFYKATADFPKKDLIALVSGFITTPLGFLFGRAAKG